MVKNNKCKRFKSKSEEHLNIRINNIIDYFNKKGLGFDSTYKLNSCRYEIHKMFDKFIYKRETECIIWEDLFKELITKEKEIRYLLKHSMYEEREYLAEYDFENNFSDDVTDEFIKNELLYISDRWNCASRLNFMINIIKYLKDNYAKRNRKKIFSKY